jgi:hypothetical protein
MAVIHDEGLSSSRFIFVRRGDFMAPLADAVIRTRRTILLMRGASIPFDARGVFLTLEPIVCSRGRTAAVRPRLAPAPPLWFFISESYALDARSRFRDISFDDVAVHARHSGEVAGATSGASGGSGDYAVCHAVGLHEKEQRSSLSLRSKVFSDLVFSFSRKACPRTRSRIIDGAMTRGRIRDTAGHRATRRADSGGSIYRVLFFLVNSDLFFLRFAERLHAYVHIAFGGLARHR